MKFAGQDKDQEAEQQVPDKFQRLATLSHLEVDKDTSGAGSDRLRAGTSHLSLMPEA